VGSALVLPLTRTTGGGGVANRTLPVGRSGTCREILGLGGRGPSCGADCGCEFEDEAGLGIRGWTGVAGFDLEGVGSTGVLASPGPAIGVLQGNGGNEVSMGVRLIGGRPLIFAPPSEAPGRHAEDTFLGPRL
jgi:hypothetical protein